MNLNRFIILSALSHALFISAFGLVSFNAVRDLPVYHVAIVGPFESEKAPEVKPVPPKASRAPMPPPQKITPPAEKDLKPESLFDGAAAAQKNSSGAHKLPSSVEPGRSAAEGKGDALPENDNEDGLPVKKAPQSLAPPSALFDRGTIEKHASRGIPADKGLSFDTSEFRHRGYMRMLKEKIERVWQYPREAARLGISGDLYIRFTIKRDGKLGDIELLRTSGYKDLDDAAMKALKDAQPFWPLPEDWEKDDLEIKGYFIYIYGNTIVM